MTPTPSRRKAAILNLIASYGILVIGIVQGVVLVPLYLAHIDLKLYGAWLATGGVLAWLSLFEAGMTNLLRQRVAVALGRGDRGEIASLVGTGGGVVTAASVLPLVGCLGLAPFLPGWFQIGGNDANTLSLAIVLAGIGTCIAMIGNIPSAVLQGLHRIPFQAVTLFAWSMVAIAFIIVGVSLGLGILAIPLGTIIRWLGTAAMRWGYLVLVIKRDFGVWPCFRRNMLRSLSMQTGWTMLDRVALQVGSRLDRVATGLIIGPEAVAVVVLVRKGWDIFSMVVNRISNVLVPGLANLHGSGNLQAYQRVARKVLHLVLVLALTGGGIALALNPAFMRIWVPEVPAASWAYHLMVAVAMIGFMLFTSAHQTLYAAGQIRRTALVGMMQVALYIGLMFSLPWLLGIIGIPISEAIGFGVGLVVLIAGSSRTVLGLTGRPSRSQLISFTKLLACSAVVPVVEAFVSDPESWSGLILRAGAYAALAATCTAAAFPRQTASLAATVSCKIKGRKRHDPVAEGLPAGPPTEEGSKE